MSVFTRSWWSKERTVIAIGIVVLSLAGFGFFFKFVEFVKSVFSNDLLNWAIVPVTTYLVVGVGFLLLFIWTVTKGDYKDIEAPKFRLFELDEQAEQDARLARVRRQQFKRG
jgi:hypothetical protein